MACRRRGVFVVLGAICALVVSSLAVGAGAEIRSTAPPPNLCAAVQAFNAEVPFRTVAEVTAALSSVASVAPSNVRGSLLALAKLVRSSKTPLEVLTAAAIGKSSRPKAAASAGLVIEAAAQQCSARLAIADALGRNAHDWAVGVCGTLQSYTNEALQATTLYQDEAESPPDAQTFIADTVEYFETQAAGMKNTVTTIQLQDGLPASDQGMALRQFFITQLSLTQTSLDQAAQQVQQVTTPDLTQAGMEVAAIGQQLKATNSAPSVPQIIEEADARFPTVGVAAAFKRAGCPGY